VGRSLRVVYADHSRLGHRGVAAGSVAAAQLEGLSWFAKPGRSEEKGWMLAADLILKCVKFPPWGRVSAPAGVAPEALEECLHSFKGYKRRLAGLLHWGGRSASFSAGIGTLSAALDILSAGTATRRST